MPDPRPNVEAALASLEEALKKPGNDAPGMHDVIAIAKAVLELQKENTDLKHRLVDHQQMITMLRQALDEVIRAGLIEGRQ